MYQDVTQKKGQIAIFIVVGLLILLLLGIFFYMETSTAAQKIAVNVQDVQESHKLQIPLQVYVENCLRETGKEALLSIGKRGGYFNIPPESDQIMQLPFYLFEATSHVPTMERILKELSAYLDANLNKCLNDFKPFKEQGYDVQYGRGKLVALLGKNELHFIAELPVTIKKGTEEISLNSFLAVIPSRLDEMHSLVSNFIIQQEENPQAFCVSCLADSSVLYDMRSEVNFVDERTLMFTITDESILIDGKPFKWYFLNKYEAEEIEELKE